MFGIACSHFRRYPVTKVQENVHLCENNQQGRFSDHGNIQKLYFPSASIPKENCTGSGWMSHFIFAYFLR
jgi:hypothetical protein